MSFIIDLTTNSNPNLGPNSIDVGINLITSTDSIDLGTTFKL